MRVLPRVCAEENLNRAFTHDYVMRLSRTVPESSGQNIFERQYDVAIITDTFMFNYYSAAFKSLKYIDPIDRDNDLLSGNYDLLLYVSCWHGHGRANLTGLHRAEKNSKILEVVQRFKRKNIPFIFQSIEDPVHYDDFLPIARFADAVFTSDSDLIEKYKKDLGHSRVYWGEYGVNPMLQNPLRSPIARYDEILFAGAFYNRYPERSKCMRMLFDFLKKNELPFLIVDRNFGSNQDWCRFPEAYAGNIIEKYEHAELQKIHKLFKTSINFNTVTTSSTMCAMRVYELQAMGVNVVSNWALSVENKFPDIFSFKSDSDLNEIFGKIYQTTEESHLETINKTFESHTVFHRVSALLGCSGIRYELPDFSFHVISIEDALLSLNSIAEDFSDDVLIIVIRPGVSNSLLAGLINSFKFSNNRLACLCESSHDSSSGFFSSTLKKLSFDDLEAVAIHQKVFPRDLRIELMKALSRGDWGGRFSDEPVTLLSAKIERYPTQCVI